MKKAIWAAVVVVSCAALAIPANAAKPKEGVYAQYKGHDQDTAVITLTVDKDKKHVHPGFYNDCAPVPIEYDIKIKHGKFSFHGTKKDLAGGKIDIDIEGKFKTSRLATGTAQAESKGCKASPVKFKAKYQGKNG